MTLPDHIFLKTYPALFKPLPAGANFKFSIKDLFDVQGEVTTAGSKVLLDSPAATADAVAVARLKAAGGIAVGRTNMSEFAFSGVGWNPHYGTPRNTMPELEAPYPARVTGGSSSGAAASVLCGLADVGLGSDTGGSLRIPAALCGLVGFKSTARLTPTAGALPLSTTLDTVGAITQNVEMAIQTHEILAARTVRRNKQALHRYRVAVVENVLQDGLEGKALNVWRASLQALINKGLRVAHLELPELEQIALMNKTGGFSPIESYRWHKDLIAARQADYDPRVAQRILQGKSATATEYLTLQRERASWIAQVSAKVAPFDAVLSPTVPIAAPTIESIKDDDTEFFRVNALLLRNPSIVNFLDGCAIAVPPNLMLWHAALRDDGILNLALRVEEALSA